MKHQTQSGWLMSLRDDPDSNWGSVESFIEGIKESPIRSGRYIMESEVWGRVGVKEMLPKKGQGIGFYHSTRARFPSPDKFGRKPRITLIGELLGIETNGKEVIYIKVAVDKKILQSMTKQPIVRDGVMVSVFEECGIKQGSVATFYYAGPEQWKHILAQID